MKSVARSAKLGLPFAGAWEIILLGIISTVSVTGAGGRVIRSRTVDYFIVFGAVLLQNTKPDCSYIPSSFKQKAIDGVWLSRPITRSSPYQNLDYASVAFGNVGMSWSYVHVCIEASNEVVW